MSRGGRVKKGDKFSQKIPWNFVEFCVWKREGERFFKSTPPTGKTVCDQPSNSVSNAAHGMLTGAFSSRSSRMCKRSGKSAAFAHPFATFL